MFCPQSNWIRIPLNLYLNTNHIAYKIYSNKCKISSEALSHEKHIKIPILKTSLQKRWIQGREAYATAQITKGRDKNLLLPNIFKAFWLTKLFNLLIKKIPPFSSVFADFCRSFLGLSFMIGFGFGNVQEQAHIMEVYCIGLGLGILSDDYEPISYLL